MGYDYIHFHLKQLQLNELHMEPAFKETYFILLAIVKYDGFDRIVMLSRLRSYLSSMGIDSSNLLIKKHNV